MPQAQESDRSEIIERAAEAAERAGRRLDELVPFLARYYRHVPVEDLAERDPIDLAGAALSHRQLAAARPQGVANVRVFTPTVDEFGWTSGHTVVEIVTDDMPFLVDSVTTELSRQERGDPPRRAPAGRGAARRDRRAARGPRHDGDPVVVVRAPARQHGRVVDPRRDRPGDRPRAARTRPGGGRARSWTTCGWRSRTGRRCSSGRATSRPSSRRRRPPVSRPRSPPRARPCCGGWPTTTSRSSATATTGWCSATADDALVAETGTGLGILRYDQHRNSPSFDRLTPQARAKAREPRLLVLTNANTRATVHRSAYLDYIGIKQFDADGEVVGERRFLGLFASSAYTDSVRGSPWSAARWPRCSSGRVSRWTATPARTCCRSSRPTPATSSSRSPSTTSTPPSWPSCTCRSAAAPGSSCGATTTAGTSRAWCSCRATGTRPPCGCGWRRSCSEAFDGADGRLQRPGQRERAGPPALRRPAALGSRLPRGGRRRARGAAGRGHPVLGRGPRRRAARRRRRGGGGAGCSAWGRGFPEAYKEDFPARVAVADLRRLEDLAPSEAGDAAGHEPLRAAWAPPSPSAGSSSTGGRRSRSPTSCPTWATSVSRSSTSAPTSWTAADGDAAWIYDFGLRYSGRTEHAPSEVRDALQRGVRGGVERARPRATASTRWCCSPGSSWRQVGVLRAYAKYLRQVGTTFSQEYIERCLRLNVEHRPAARAAVRGPLRPRRDRRRGAEGRRELADGLVEEIQQCPGRRHQPRPRPDPALVPHPGAGDDAHERLPARGRRVAQAVPVVQARPAGRARTCRSRGRRTRSSSTPRGSRACICGSATWPAAGCAGATAGRTSGPRSSAW